MSLNNTLEQNEAIEDHDPEITRKQACRRTGYSPASYATWDSRKTYDLKPRRKGREIVYRQSIIDAHANSRLVRQKRNAQV